MCITINMKDPEDYDVVYPEMLQSIPGIRFYAFQLEMGEEGNLHYQCFIALSKPQRYPAIKKVLGECHIERAMGTDDECEAYCTKEDTRIEGPWVWGTKSGQGKRSDLLAAKELIDSGMNYMDVRLWDGAFGAMVKYGRGLREYATLKSAGRDHKTEVHVLFGEAGTGKTRFVMDNHPRTDVYVKPNGAWFDGYAGEPVVLMDEFRGDVCFSVLKQALDRYPCRVPVKGAMVNWAPKVVYLCSNSPPHAWYDDKKEALEPLFRRFTSVKYMSWTQNMGGERVVDVREWKGEKCVYDYMNKSYMIDM